MARLSLVPQRREFFDLYSRASNNVVEIAEALAGFLQGFPDGAEDGVRRIEELEHEGDRLTHDVVDLLNRTFVTPFDRDDMYRLASALDDVCDHVDEAAGDTASYGVQRVRPVSMQQAEVILRCARKLDEAVAHLEGFKVQGRILIELRELEDEGDRLVRDAVAELFRSERDPIALIRWKEIYEQLEDAVDACENAADVLEAILVKNK
jgi:predicted phosphate transport protein (TIGR00153 family)